MLYNNKVKYSEWQGGSTTFGDPIKFESITKGMYMNLTSEVLYDIK